MKPKTNRQGKVYVAQGMDLCQTPPYAVEPLLPHLPLSWTLWEPACGEGLLAEKLSKTHRVIETDLEAGYNFFGFEPALWQAIVTNPPYSIKYLWLAHCYELGKPFALLLPVETLGTKSGQRLFKRYGLEVIFLDDRVNFSMPHVGFEGSRAQFPVAWFTWGLEIGHEMTFAELPPKRERTGQLPLFPTA